MTELHPQIKRKSTWDTDWDYFHWKKGQAVPFFIYLFFESMRPQNHRILTKQNLESLNGLAKERKHSFVTFFPYKWSYPTLSERNNTFLMAIKAIVSFCHVQLWVVDCIKLSFISSSKISFFLLPVQPSTCRMGTGFFFRSYPFT